MTRPVRSPEATRIVLLEDIHATAVSSFAEAGCTQVVQHRGALQGEALVEAIGDAELLGIRSRSRVTAEVLRRAPRLAAIGAFCIGTDQIDLDAAARAGIPVFNAPFSNTRSVAELVLAEIVMLMRGIPEKNAALHRGVWRKSAAGSHEVRGKTLGIVGYGHIGTQIGVLAEQLGMHVVFHDIVDRLPLGNARPVGELGTLLELSDVVSLHVPDTPATRGMMGAAELARMRQGGLLINASRGGVVDLEALAAALDAGALRGAAIDVFPHEPQGDDPRFDSPLMRHDQVLLTPHIGGSTAEAQASIGREVASKLVRYLQLGGTVSAVNFPELSLPPIAGASRLLHVHRNVPGVLAHVNERFAEAGLNIAAQYLRTSESIGYAVIDTDAAADELAYRALCKVPETIRCRILV